MGPLDTPMPQIKSRNTSITGPCDHYVVAYAGQGHHFAGQRSFPEERAIGQADRNQFCVTGTE